MAASKPARLCALVFPAGNRCGSPALRNQPYCYHHAGNHQEYTRDRFLCEGRIEEITALESRISCLLQSNQELAPMLHSKLNQTENLPTAPLNSIT